MIREYPYYHLIPECPDKNLSMRYEIISTAAEDPYFAASIRDMCAKDAMFYMNMFGWTYDPRDRDSPRKPFVTYREYQDEAIDELIDAVERGYDLAWPKSRSMGASWMGIFTLEWMWHFLPDLSFLFISRTEDYVDKKGNPKSLFWKIDMIHESQPRWLLPTNRWMGAKDPNRKALHFRNADTNSVIDGESTTGDAGRGDRRTAMFIDEFAAFQVADGFKVLNASRDTCKCRVFNSTPQGAANAFYEVVHNSGAKIRRMHWSSHPQYAQGLYTSEKDGNGIFKLKILNEHTGKVKVIRKGMKKVQYKMFPESYPFILDGKLRSPWYDEQEARCVSPQELAQELNIDFLGSDYQFFDPETINMLIAEYCIPPMMTGHIVYDPATLEPTGFDLDPKGPLCLWFQLAGNGIINDRTFFRDKQFALGGDVAMGTGASNSAASIVDLASGKKVAVWRDPNTPPEKFADVMVALCKWFNNAFLIWDATGAPGRSCTKRILERKYHRIYYRKSEERTRARISDQPGYYLNPEDRAVLLRDYRIKLQDRKFINQSTAGMRECLQFIVQPGGKVEHSAAANSQNPTGAKDAHGDEVIADALASRALAMKGIDIIPEKEEIPWMSPAWRLREAEQEARNREYVDW